MRPNDLSVCPIILECSNILGGWAVGIRTYFINYVKYMLNVLAVLYALINSFYKGWLNASVNIVSILFIVSAL